MYDTSHAEHGDVRPPGAWMDRVPVLMLALIFHLERSWFLINPLFCFAFFFLL
jgi:hypothetical protein